jgi:Zn-dependent protease with chaperone function
VDLDLRALLIFAAVFGMGGSFISLAISKWTAKRFTGQLRKTASSATPFSRRLERNRTIQEGRSLEKHTNPNSRDLAA